MNTMLGIWIDHRDAVLVSVKGGLASVRSMESGVEPRTHASGGRKAGGTSVAQSITNEQRMDERHKHQIHDFYQEVIKAANGAEAVYIFGPGAAKQELAGEIEKTKSLRVNIVAVETCDKLTEPQIVAKVKTFFKEQVSNH